MNKVLAWILSVLVGFVVILGVILSGIIIKNNFGIVKPIEKTKEEPIVKTEVKTEEPKEEELTETKDSSLTFNIDSLKKTAEKVYAGVYFFEDGKEFMTESEKTPSASIIKLFIMEYAYSEIGKGNYTEQSLINGTYLEFLLNAMIKNSDNNATNVLISEFGMENINTFIKNSGYNDTVLGRKMLEFEAQQRGEDNYTSLNDVMAFLKKIYNNKDVYPYNAMLEIMKGQTVKTKLPVNLPYGTVIAHKTGELSDVENDAGIVFSPNGDYAVLVLTNKTTTPVNTREAISVFSKEVYDFINN